LAWYSWIFTDRLLRVRVADEVREEVPSRGAGL